MHKKKFIVHVNSLEEFLGILDDGECALITYQGYPNDNYIVELGTPIWWDKNETFVGVLPLD